MLINDPDGVTYYVDGAGGDGTGHWPCWYLPYNPAPVVNYGTGFGPVDPKDIKWIDCSFETDFYLGASAICNGSIYYVPVASFDYHYAANGNAGRPMTVVAAPPGVLYTDANGVQTFGYYGVEVPNTVNLYTLGRMLATAGYDFSTDGFFQVIDDVREADPGDYLRLSATYAPTNDAPAVGDVLTRTGVDVSLVVSYTNASGDHTLVLTKDVISAYHNGNLGFQDTVDHSTDAGALNSDRL